MANSIDNTEDILDVRDIIARVEELEAIDEPEWVEADEQRSLESLLADLKGNGGDEQWRGDWYPVTLVRDSYFVDYAQQLAEDIGAIDPDASWPLGFIDWERAADALLMDYTSVEFDGVTYWTR